MLGSGLLACCTASVIELEVGMPKDGDNFSAVEKLIDLLTYFCVSLYC
jgi:hypothetical protein